MWVLLQFELKYYIKKPIELAYFIGLFLSILLLSPFADASINENQHLKYGTLSIALIVAIAANVSTIFARDYQSGRYDCYGLLSVPLGGLMFVKWLAYYIAIALPLLLMLPVAGLLYAIPSEHWLHCAIGLATSGAGLSLIGAMVSAFMAGSGKVGAILSLIILPLSIPIMVFGTHYLSQTELFAPSLLFQWGFIALLLPIYCFASAACVRASA